MGTMGTAVRNGIELARSDYPQLFRKMRFIYEDDQFDIKQSIAAYRKLRDIDESAMIFGLGSTLGLVLGPMADQDNILLINLNFDALAAIGRKLLVRSMNHTRQYMQVLASYFETRGVVEFNVVQSESLFFNSMVQSFEDSVAVGSVVDVLARYNPTETDFRATIIRLKSMSGTKKTRPTGIFLAPEQLIEFLKQAQELNFHTLFFGTDLFETAAETAPDSSIFQGCLYPDNEVSVAFRERYRQNFGQTAQITFAASAYEMAILFGERLSVAQTFNPITLVSELVSVHNRSSVMGEYNFRRDPELGMFFEFPVQVKKIVGVGGVPAGQ